jgi:hypothetical protein
MTKGKKQKEIEKICKCKIPDMVWEWRGSFCDRCGGRIVAKEIIIKHHKEEKKICPHPVKWIRNTNKVGLFKVWCEICNQEFDWNPKR